MKSSSDGATPSSGRTSGKISQPPSPPSPSPPSPGPSPGPSPTQCQEEVNTDYTADVLDNFQSTTKAECCEKCEGNACCKVAVWRTDGGCWLKASLDGKKSSSNTNAYIVNREIITPVVQERQSCPTWYEQTKHGLGWRNVLDYGAKGDGVTNDWPAIQNALTQDRQSNWTRPDTSDPVVVYFPPGNYMINDTLDQYLYTQMVGNYKCRPKITLMDCSAPKGRKFMVTATGTFTGEHVSNFYHQIINIDLSLGNNNPGGSGIHWAVAQATMLRNMTINATGGDSGIWVENGGGGSVADVEVIGGKQGIFIGGQQWTFRNLKVSKSTQCGVYINWNWLMVFQGLVLEDMHVGLSLASGSGSVTLVDTQLRNIFVGVTTGFPAQIQAVLVDGLNASNTSYLVDEMKGQPGGNAFIDLWYQGYGYNKGTPYTELQGKLVNDRKIGEALIPDDVALPTYDGEDIFNVYDAGAKGDNKTDDTAALQKALNQHKRVFLPSGVYIVSDTLKVPSNGGFVGECWSLIQLKAGAKGFQDPDNTKPFIFVEQGAQKVYFSNIIIGQQDYSSAPGAVMVEWGGDSSCRWNDVHYRMYGGAHTLLSMTGTAGGYFENCWLWVADHNINWAHTMNITNPYGLVLSSSGPSWFMGFASEHSSIANFQLNKASHAKFFGLQTETAYWESPPKTWMMDISSSHNIKVYGGVGENW
eukprot:CAMPEP_0175129472 /NCGR_PEP_ID=MMETSP0087-20121206/5490_1 /TAXON_ID=136419 /ORGANISM="Unknown Unknown, Strain D1" /LENGTH=698 /DNA_ID=CAMNT_0016411623 /DNA_START=237 /DNA_END=2330 /DNA_ORIENTATION=+